MKLLLTGKPRSGKTTLLEYFVSKVADKQGFLTREVQEEGQRTGFELVSSDGLVATLASVDSTSTVRVSKYGVKVHELEAFLEKLPSIRTGSLVYADEIGQMELYSAKFKEHIMAYLNATNSYAGTITSVFHDDFTKQIFQRTDIVLLTVGDDTRDNIREALDGLAQNLPLLDRLNPAMQQGITQMARQYAEPGALIQLKKLFKNAIAYLGEERIEQINSHTFRVHGNTNQHLVVYTGESWTCDCNLFRGVGNFIGTQGECSHIQAAKLYRQALTNH